jgi:hypothetical protein
MHRLELWPLRVTEPSPASVLPSNVEKISSYIIFTRSVEDFTVQAEKLFGCSSWDSRGLFLIVITVKVPNSEDLALSIVQEMWQIGRGYNVVVMVQQDTLLNLYTWFPYSSHDNCGDVRNVVLINQWVMKEEGKFMREGSLLPYKIPSKFHSCAINLSTLFKGQIEDKYYSLYFMTGNLTRNYVKEFRDDTPSEEKFLTIKKNLRNRETDKLFGGVHLVEEFSNAETSFPYLVFKFSWFVPCPKPFLRLQRIFHIFSLSVCICVAVILFLVTVVSWCLAKQSNDIGSYANMSSAFYNIWAVTAGVSVAETPRSLRLKLFNIVFSGAQPRQFV